MPSMIAACDICGRVKMCEWLEDPNTGDGFFCCMDGDDICIPQDDPEAEW